MPRVNRFAYIRRPRLLGNAGCQRFSDDSHQFALDLLDATGVAITPGIDFGLNHPERHVRIAYTTDIDNLEQAAEHIRRFVGG